MAAGRTAKVSDDAVADSAPKRLSGRQRVKVSGPVVESVDGGVSRSVAALVETLGVLSPSSAVLAAAALALARELDGGAGMAAAAAVRELRATLVELTAGAGSDDAFNEWEAQLGSA